MRHWGAARSDTDIPGPHPAESWWQSSRKKESRDAEPGKNDQRNRAFPEQDAGTPHVAIRGSLEQPIEPAEERAQRSAGGLSRLEQQPRQRRTERQRVEG